MFCVFPRPDISYRRATDASTRESSRAFNRCKTAKANQQAHDDYQSTPSKQRSKQPSNHVLQMQISKLNATFKSFPPMHSHSQSPHVNMSINPKPWPISKLIATFKSFPPMPSQSQSPHVNMTITIINKFITTSKSFPPIPSQIQSPRVNTSINPKP